MTVKKQNENSLVGIVCRVFPAEHGINPAGKAWSFRRFELQYEINNYENVCTISLSGTLANCECLREGDVVEVFFTPRTKINKHGNCLNALYCYLIHNQRTKKFYKDINPKLVNQSSNQ